MKNELLLLIPFEGGVGKEQAISQGCRGEGAFGDHQGKPGKVVGERTLPRAPLAKGLAVGDPKGEGEAKKL